MPITGQNRSGFGQMPGKRRSMVLYDADCGLCKWLLSGLLRWDRAGNLQPLALQRPEAQELLIELSLSERMAAWHLISPAGERSSGGAALAVLLRSLPAGRYPAAVFACLPGATERGYRWVAEHRSQLSRCVPAGAKRRAEGRCRAARAPAREATGVWTLSAEGGSATAARQADAIRSSSVRARPSLPRAPLGARLRRGR